MAMRATCLLLMLAAAAAVLPGAAAQRRRVLTDDNFEHTTQAATGQTTGVWFVSFCSPSARACKDLAGAWEELGRELLQAQPPVFLSTVDPHASPALARRFGISTLPTLLLFRDRKARREHALHSLGPTQGRGNKRANCSLPCLAPVLNLHGLASLCCAAPFCLGV